MAGEQQRKPVVRQTPSPADEDDYTSPYPCGVCGQGFTSRSELATHPHRKAARV